MYPIAVLHTKVQGKKGVLAKVSENWTVCSDFNGSQERFQGEASGQFSQGHGGIPGLPCAELGAVSLFQLWISYDSDSREVIL